MFEQIIYNFETIHIYLLVVGSLSTILLLRGLFIIKAEKSKRLKLIKKMDYQEAVISPEHNKEEYNDDNALLANKKFAAQSVQTRFEFMRRFYIPLVLFVSFVFLIIPFLPTLPATYLSLFTGLIAGIVGFASKPVIENAIAGMVLTFSQPIRINDTVIIDEKYGTVEKINLLHTVIKIWNWRRLVIPNHKLLEKEIVNLTLGDESEWAYISFFIEPQTDISMVKKIAKEAMNSEYLDDHEPPSFWVMELNKDSILCWAAGWASDPARAWALKSAARTNLIKALNDHGVKFHMANTNINLNPEEISKFKQQ